MQCCSLIYITMFRSDKTYSRDRAFTLVEVILVTVVFGVAATFAVPRLAYTIERMRAEEGKQILLALYAAQKRYWQENGQNYTDNLDDLDVNIRNSPYFENIQVSTASPLAQLERKNGTYTLTIDEQAQIYCTGTMCYEMGL